MDVDQLDISALTTKKCHEFRKNGTLKLLLLYLHKHTTEKTQNRHLPTIVENYRRDIPRRRHLSKVFSHIICETLEHPKEWEILNRLKMLRWHVEDLYEGYDKPTLECSAIVSKTVDIFTFSPQYIEEFGDILEMLGGSYVFLDVILAIFRFCRENGHSDNCFSLSEIHMTNLAILAIKRPNLQRFLITHQPFMRFITVCLNSMQQTLNNFRLIHPDALDDVFIFIQGISHLLNVIFTGQQRDTYREERVPTIEVPDMVKYLMIILMKIDHRQTTTAVVQALSRMSVNWKVAEDIARMDGAVEHIVSIYKKDPLITNEDPFSASRVECAGLILVNMVTFVGDLQRLLKQLRPRNFCSILVKKLKSPAFKMINNKVCYIVTGSTLQDLCLVLNISRSSMQAKRELLKLGIVEVCKNIEKFTSQDSNHGEVMTLVMALYEEFGINF